MPITEGAVGPAGLPTADPTAVTASADGANPSR
jgi:hypothetical protein